MRIKAIDPSHDSRWNEFVEKHRLGCAFHHSAWKEVIEKTFPRVKPHYFIVEDEDGNIAGGMPFFYVKSWLTGKRLVSLPFSLYCDPLINSDKAFEYLIEDILKKQRELRAHFIEIRTRFTKDLFKYTNFREFIGYKNHTLALDPDLQILKKSFHRTCIRQRINRAEQSNVAVVEASSESDMKTFFELHCMTRKKYGVPPQPYSFFRNMWEILYPRKMLGILIAKYENQPVSSLLFLKYKQRIHAEYMGTNDEFLKYSPNILLFWKAIEQSKAEGYRFFDFGGSFGGNVELITFKRRWGTVEEDLSHYYFPSIRGLSTKVEEGKSYKVMTQATRKMPDQLFRWTGKLLYRHMGG